MLRSSGQSTCAAGDILKIVSLEKKNKVTSLKGSNSPLNQIYDVMLFHKSHLIHEQEPLSVAQLQTGQSGDSLGFN